MISEPFSVTLAVFAVIGFVNLARQGAQAVHNSSKKYTAAPEDIHEFFSRATRAEYDLKLWKQIWAIQDYTHEDYPECLWEDGWKHIKHQIETIERISCKIEKILQPLIREYMTKGPGQASHSLTGSNDLKAVASLHKAMRESDVERIKSDLWWRNKIPFVLSKSTTLDELLKEISENFEKLKSRCEEAYFQAHDQPTSIRYGERRDTAIIQMIRSQVSRTREDSQTLHKVCRSTTKGDMELELSLLQWRSRKHQSTELQPLVAGLPDHLRYCLTISPSMLRSILEDDKGSMHPQQLEICIEKKFRSLGKYETDFRDVCKELSNDKNCFFQSSVLEPMTIHTPSVFWVSKPSDPVTGSGRNDSKLSSLLTRPAENASSEDLSLRERVELAFRLAECCLLLLKTSWLSNFESCSITRAHCAGKTSRYRLLIGPEFQEDVHENRQILRLGTLLRELALGTSAEAYDWGRESPLVLTGLGKDYHRATNFCCTSRIRGLISQEEHEKFYQETLEDVIREVFLPYVSCCP